MLCLYAYIENNIKRYAKIIKIKNNKRENGIVSKILKNV